MDPDDYISVSMYEDMYSNLIDKRCDVCLYNYIKLENINWWWNTVKVF